MSKFGTLGHGDAAGTSTGLMQCRRQREEIVDWTGTPAPGCWPLREALLNQCEVGVALCDADGALAAINRRLEALLGSNYHPSRPEDWSAAFHLYDDSGEYLLPPCEDPLARAVRGEAVVDQVVAVRPPGEAIRFLRCNATRIHHSDGEVAGAVVFVADATQEITQRRALDTLREQLVETVNHELRTPVAVVKGHAELLEELRADLPPRAHWSLDAITRGLTRLEAVLDSIRQLADQTTRH